MLDTAGALIFIKLSERKALYSCPLLNFFVTFLFQDKKVNLE
jgi:hypothetical protein